MNEQKRWVKWLCDNAVSLVGGFTGVGTIITAVTEWLRKYNFSVLEYILLAILLLCSIIIICYQIWLRTSCRSIYYPRSFIHSSYNYIIEKKKISYIRDEDDNLDYKRELTIKCIGNKLEEIRDKYIWTGEGTQFDIKGTSGIKDITLENRVGIWEYFRIALNNTIKKSGTATIAYAWPTIPNCSKSNPFISVATEEPTRHLTMELNLGKNYSQQKIFCEEYRSSDSDYHIFRSEHELNDSGCFTWEIKKPNRFRVYQIRWNWDKGKEPTEIL